MSDHYLSIFGNPMSLMRPLTKRKKKKKSSITKPLTDPGGFLFFQLAHSELCRVGENLKGVSVYTYTRSVLPRYDVVSGVNNPF